MKRILLAITLLVSTSTIAQKNPQDDMKLPAGVQKTIAMQVSTPQQIAPLITADVVLLGEEFPQAEGIVLKLLQGKRIKVKVITSARAVTRFEPLKKYGAEVRYLEGMNINGGSIIYIGNDAILASSKDSKGKTLWSYIKDANVASQSKRTLNMAWQMSKIHNK